MTIWWPYPGSGREGITDFKPAKCSYVHWLTPADLENVRSVVGQHRFVRENDVRSVVGALYYQDQKWAYPGGVTSVFYLPYNTTQWDLLCLHLEVTLMLRTWDPLQLRDTYPQDPHHPDGYENLHALFYTHQSQPILGANLRLVLVLTDPTKTWPKCPGCALMRNYHCDAYFVGTSFWYLVEKLDESDAPLTSSMVRLTLTEAYKQMRAASLREWPPPHAKQEDYYEVPGCVKATIECYCALFPEQLIECF